MTAPTVLTVGSYNLSIAAAKHHPDALVGDLVALFEEHDLDVLGMQEAGAAAKPIRQAAHALGAVVYDGKGLPGQASTPLMFRGDLDVEDVNAHPLTHRTYVGPAGAGPESMKAKHLLTVSAHVGGRLVTVGNTHGIVSSYLPARRLLARQQFRRAAAILDAIPGLTFLTADTNQHPGARVLRPLLDAGLVSTQTVLGEVPTGPHNDPIDDVYALNRHRLELLEHFTAGGVSDHDAYVARFGIHPRRRHL